VDLEDTLDKLLARRVLRAKFVHGDLTEVEFAPEAPGPAPATPFVDADGKPVDFDADMPPLGRDMVAEANLVKPAGS